MDRSSNQASFTAYSPSAQVLFGYEWERRDFPWLGIWRRIGRDKINLGTERLLLVAWNSVYRLFLKVGKRWCNEKRCSVLQHFDG